MIRDGSPYPAYFAVTYNSNNENVTRFFKVWKGSEQTHRLALINYLIKCNRAILYILDITEDIGYDGNKYECVEVNRLG